MSAQTEIATVATTVQDASVTAEGFGVPLIACAHSYWVEPVRTFGSLVEMVTAGAATTHHMYKKAAAFWAQNPGVATVKVGARRATAYTHTLDLTVPATADGDIASLTIGGVSYEAAQATGSKAIPLDAVINAISGLSSSEAAGVVTIVAAAADALLEISDLVGCTIKDVTTDSGIAADLAAILTADADWYGLVIDGHSEAQINAAAAWAETAGKLASFVSQDDEILDAGETTDIGSDLNTAGLHYSPIQYHTKPVEQCADARWSGLMLPKDPGSATWANKHPAGLDRLTLTDGQVAAAKAKKVNVYVDIKGLGFMLWGWAPSGRYMDITRGIDWYDSQLATRLLNLQANVDKIPYTDGGMAMGEAQVRAQIAAGQAVGLIALDPVPVVTVPLIATATTAQKAAREFPPITTSFVLQGAAHSITVNGTASL